MYQELHYSGDNCYEFEHIEDLPELQLLITPLVSLFVTFDLIFLNIRICNHKINN